MIPLKVNDNFEFNLDVPVKVKKLNERAIIPKYQTEGAAAFDVHALIEEGQVVRVSAHSQKIIHTGLAMAIPKGYELRVSPRSGQSAKYEISIRNSPGIIDSDYTKEIMIIFVNNADKDFIVNHGDRVAQIKLSFVPRAVFEEVEEIEETERGDGCCSSTGK